MDFPSAFLLPWLSSSLTIHLRIRKRKKGTFRREIMSTYCTCWLDNKAHQWQEIEMSLAGGRRCGFVWIIFARKLIWEASDTSELMPPPAPSLLSDWVTWLECFNVWPGVPALTSGRQGGAGLRASCSRRNARYDKRHLHCLYELQLCGVGELLQVIISVNELKQLNWF